MQCMKRHFFIALILVLFCSLFSQTDELAVATESIYDINGTMVIADGHISIPDGANVIQHGFCWNTSDEPSIENFRSEMGSIGSSGKFTFNVTELECSTEYYIRAYAQTPYDTVYGNIKHFVTLDYISEKPAGSGTEGDPYIIRKLDHLYWMSLHSSEWDCYYRQTKDIDAYTTEDWYDGQGWNPIGNTITKFTGHYDGEGHVIKNLYLKRFYNMGIYATSQSNLGLFGITYNAYILSLGLIDARIYGDFRVGGLIGHGIGTTISDCYVIGSVNNGQEIGVLIGRSDNSTIERCYSSGNATGMACAGGIVGVTSSSSISNCYSTATAVGQHNAGGMAGVSIRSSYSNCYSVGMVSAHVTSKGGFIGSDLYNHNNTFSASFSAKDPLIGTCLSDLDGLECLDRSILRIKDTFLNSGWDFIKEDENGTDDIWGINEETNDGYPYLAIIAMMSDIEDDELSIPDQITLLHNYPNPFNPRTMIEFTLPNTQNIVLTIYNSIGQTVEVLYDGNLSAGQHSIDFNAGQLNTGIYYYSLQTENGKLTGKMLLLK
ncbi:MAG: T9SS type A sorting domain-containing protein [Candidatus Delongbacteria bacterium]|nr:T9SS type A sorting domain-containing protein [Candidatus Delongbacteria bacterium]